VLSNLKWRLAKLGWKLVLWWARDQKSIDGDWTQVSEIMDEWWDKFWLEEEEVL